MFVILVYGLRGLFALDFGYWYMVKTVELLHSLLYDSLEGCLLEKNRSLSSSYM